MHQRSGRTRCMGRFRQLSPVDQAQPSPPISPPVSQQPALAICSFRTLRDTSLTEKARGPPPSRLRLPDKTGIPQQPQPLSCPVHHAQSSLLRDPPRGAQPRKIVLKSGAGHFWKLT